MENLDGFRGYRYRFRGSIVNLKVPSLNGFSNLKQEIVWGGCPPTHQDLWFAVSAWVKLELYLVVVDIAEEMPLG